MGEPTKTDFKKTLDSYQGRHHVLRLLELPPMQYLMVDGHGDPNTSTEFADASAALFPVAYKLKFASKKELGKDYVVMPLEGLWWSDDPASFTTARDKSTWDWTLMIMVPEWTTPAMFEAAVATVAATAKQDPPASIDKVRLETLAEGHCVQTLHVGSFDDEGPILATMHDQFIPEHGLEPAGKHHEIYFSDFRTVEASKLRTIVRQPVRPRT